MYYLNLMYNLINESFGEYNSQTGKNNNILWFSISSCDIYYTMPHFKDQLNTRYIGYSKEETITHVKQAIKRLITDGELNKVCQNGKQQKYVIWFKKSHWGFVMAINPPNKFNPKPTMYFITALPEKENVPYHKAQDILKIIEESCQYNNLILKIFDI